MSNYELVARDTDDAFLRAACRAAQASNFSDEDPYGERNPYRTVLRNLLEFFVEPDGNIHPDAQPAVSFLWRRAEEYDERGF